MLCVWCAGRSNGSCADIFPTAPAPLLPNTTLGPAEIPPITAPASFDTASSKSGTIAGAVVGGIAGLALFSVVVAILAGWWSPCSWGQQSRARKSGSKTTLSPTVQDNQVGMHHNTVHCTFRHTQSSRHIVIGLVHIVIQRQCHP